MSHQHHFHVITGASGAGKSTLLAALRDLGYATVPEAGREILQEQLAREDGILPWTDPAAFMPLVLERDIRNHQRAALRQGPVFFDRAAPECLAWLRRHGVELKPNEMAATQCRYAGTVFLAEPWPEIYVQDDARRANFERAARSYESTVAAYVEAGYATCVIPKAPVQERVAFVLRQLAVDTCWISEPGGQACSVT